MIAMRPPTPTLNVLLAETVRQIAAARLTIARIEGGMEDIPADINRLELVRDCTRVTARLTSVLSWLLAQKAKAAGELVADDEPAIGRLFGVGDERVAPPPDEDGTGRPPVVAEMLAESGRLFRRVARLDGKGREE